MSLGTSCVEIKNFKLFFVCKYMATFTEGGVWPTKVKLFLFMAFENNIFQENLKWFECTKKVMDWGLPASIVIIFLFFQDLVICFVKSCQWVIVNTYISIQKNLECKEIQIYECYETKLQ